MKWKTEMVTSQGPKLRFHKQRLIHDIGVVRSPGMWTLPEGLCSTRTNATHPSSTLLFISSWTSWKSMQLKEQSSGKTPRPMMCTGAENVKIKKIRFLSCCGPLSPTLSRETPQRMKPRRPFCSWFFLWDMWIHLEIWNGTLSGWYLSPNFQEPYRLVRHWLLSTSCILPHNGQKAIHDLSSYLTERLSRCHKPWRPELGIVISSG